MRTSELFAGSAVVFPAFAGERVYMREFMPGRDLPPDLERWQPTVDAMLRGVRSTGPAFLMIDQAEVLPGSCHRRPGLHMDGYWHSGISVHGPSPSPAHRPAPAPLPGHVFAAGAREALIIAADVEGCEAFEGEWDGSPGPGGDCEGVSVDQLKRQRLRAGVAWIGETGALLHSAIPLSTRTRRTVVRINATGWLQ